MASHRTGLTNDILGNGTVKPFQIDNGHRFAIGCLLHEVAVLQEDAFQAAGFVFVHIRPPKQ
ncbi:hypothetical protein D3C71_2237280 [compost metagenome]